MGFSGRKRGILSALIAFELIAMSVLPVSAGLGGGGGSVPSPTKVATTLERRYHLNLGSIQNQGEAFNVADNKKVVPEVSIFFSPSDPKEGQKLTAQAFPAYFASDEKSLYYTWYLFRESCSSATCDYDKDGDYDEEDWKIEAARILAQGSYDPEAPSAGSDDDGYKAKFGGDSKVSMPNHCYVHEPTNGVNYEIVSNISGFSSACSGGHLVCLVGSDTLSATSLILGSGPAFEFTDSNECHVAGYPTCSGGTLRCDTGTVSCLASEPTTSTVSCPGNPALSNLSCSVSTHSSAGPKCVHLFPDAPGHETGDGAFGTAEENFWGTDPLDPSTANNGNKDEANVAGLGQTSFSWSYIAGDKVGVAVEGTSMTPTKHNDASYMIMWAFPKRDCSALDISSSTGSYYKGIKGYSVAIPSASGVNLNKCLKKNLVDPTESVTGSDLDVSVAISPEAPTNDATGENGGDIVSAQASISNGNRGLTETLFEWEVHLSNNARFSDNGSGDRVVDITKTLQSMGLLGNTQGNALDAVSLRLNIPSVTLQHPSVFNGSVPDPVYIRFSVKASENVSGSIVRRGRGSAMTRFVSTDRKMRIYPATVVMDAGRSYADVSAVPICEGAAADDLDKRLCRVIKNEIIGLRISPAAGLSDFSWTINGVPLSCSKSVSDKCEASSQNEYNFFPVTGNPGDSYTVTMNANDTATGKPVTLSRAFHVVSPEVAIVSSDKSAAWPKLLGQYRDITGAASGCPSGLCNDYSRDTFRGLAGAALSLKAEFIPSFIGPAASRSWTADGAPAAEVAVGEISVAAAKAPGSVINVSLESMYGQSPDMRKALYDIWGISPLDSPEHRFSSSIQIELEDADSIVEKTGPKRYLAAIASHLPASVIFAFRMVVAAVLALFTAGVFLALMPENGFRRRD